MTSTYPMYSSNATPTVRSAQAQQRINDFASKIFTPYELQKLRTYIPGIKFVVEEAGLYKQNIVEKSDLLKKLQGFVASVYIYDILGSLMRDINERVRRATDSSLLEVDRAEMAKLVNALRGFVATEKAIPKLDKVAALATAVADWEKEKDAYVKSFEPVGGWPGGGDKVPYENVFQRENPKPTAAKFNIVGRTAELGNALVYMHRIPPTTMAQIDALDDMAAAAPKKSHKIPSSGIANGVTEISAYWLRPENLPTYNLLLGGHASDDSVRPNFCSNWHRLLSTRLVCP
eukprot:jgi/Mesvir1/9243/Mv03719-RA.1